MHWIVVLSISRKNTWKCLFWDSPDHIWLYQESKAAEDEIDTSDTVTHGHENTHNCLWFGPLCVCVELKVFEKSFCAHPKWVQFCSSLIHASMINRKPNSTICVCQAWPTSQCPSMPAHINHYSWWGSKTKKCRKTFERRSTELTNPIEWNWM